jgi:uncharacterized membrane protein
MFKDYPSLHPLAIHFPIVLILLSVAFQAVVVWKPKWIQIRWTTMFIMAGGFLSAWSASTLFHAMIAPNAPKSSWIAFNAHEEYAQYTLWMAGITLLLKAIGDFFKINRRSYDTIVLIAAIIAAIFLSIASHHGARLTHIEGVGPMGRYLGTEEDEKNMENGNMKMGDMKMDSSIKMDDSMGGMNMQVMDTMKGMKGMDDMKNMPGMDKTDDKNSMKEMKGMENMKNMPGMDKTNSKNNMSGMKGMDNMKDMPGMNKSNDKSNMNGMKGMDNMKDMPNKDKSSNKSNMDDMEGMEGMDNMKNMPGVDKPNDKTNMEGMKGMDNMKGMNGMKNMKGMKLIDPSKPYDNNPAREQRDSTKRG